MARPSDHDEESPGEHRKSGADARCGVRPLGSWSADGQAVGVVHVVAASTGWLWPAPGAGGGGGGAGLNPGRGRDPGGAHHPAAPLGAQRSPGLGAGGGPVPRAGGPADGGGAAVRVASLPSRANARDTTATSRTTSTARGSTASRGMDYGDNLTALGLLLPRGAGPMLPRVIAQPLRCCTATTGTPRSRRRTCGRTTGNDLPFARGIRSVLTVHNAGFQGHYAADGDARHRAAVGAVHLAACSSGTASSTCSRAGIKFADAVTTVSPTHAHELRTVGGFGLHDVFVALRDRFTGIVNGIDTPTGTRPTTRSSPTTTRAPSLAQEAEQGSRCSGALGSRAPGGRR
jgi:hypothetical protein